MRIFIWCLLFSCMSIVAAAAQISPAPDDLIGLRKNYDFWRKGLPAGDLNEQGIGGGPTSERMVFSESISYCLFSSVLPVEGENEDEMKQRFRDCWDWAKANMVRKNVPQVFSWESKSWVDMPAKLSDNLMAWRYIRGINGKDGNGIVYTTQDDNGVWHDGSQTATDGDLLTAYSLYLGYERGWGDDLLTDAQNTVRDIRKKNVVNFKAGELYNASALTKPDNLYSGAYVDKSDPTDHDTGTIKEDLTDIPDALGWQGRNNYLGFYFNSLLDLRELDRIEIVMKGSVGAKAAVDVRLQDTAAVKGDDNQPGHVWSSFPLELTDQFQTVTLYPDDFGKNSYFGTKVGELNWQEVKNIQFQMGKIDWYSTYIDTYPYNGDGTQTIMTDLPGELTWKGNKNFVGFTMADVLDLTDVQSIELSWAGSGKAELKVMDDLDDNWATDEHVFTTGELTLPGETITTRSFTRENFSPAPYTTQALGGMEWAKIKKFQIQVNNTESTVTFKSLLLTYNNGKVYTIKWLGPKPILPEESTVYVKSINVVLKTGQTAGNDGYKLLSNAHGSPYINPSYFMPFAYRAFAKIDPEGRDVWTALTDATYDELDQSLRLTLRDLEHSPVTGNGKLVPNWYMFNNLTGERVDIETQKPASNDKYNVKGFLFGYDAFRTVWFIALDYSLNRDPRAKAFLKEIEPFFREKLDAGLGFCDVYRIDGEIEADTNCPGAAGFSAVYANLFKALNDPIRAKKAIALVMAEKKVKEEDGRIWFNEGNDEEYFMNYWAFFGLFSTMQNSCISGDMDGNGIIDLSDALLVLKILAGVDAIPFCEIADVDGNSKVSMKEVLFILRKIGSGEQGN